MFHITKRDLDEMVVWQNFSENTPPQFCGYRGHNPAKINLKYENLAEKRKSAEIQRKIDEFKLRSNS